MVLHVRRATPAAPAAALQYTKAASPVEYFEEQAILFGSPTCGFSKIHGLAAATRQLIDSIRGVALARGDSFSTVGVSLEGPASDGEAWLYEFDKFDELIIGHNWLNSAVVAHIWSDPDAKPAIPQLVLIRRHIRNGQRSIAVGQDSVVRRWVGVGELAPAVARSLRY
ncbi:MAG TPA: hypothetical protein VFK16_04670 [Gemmatimonadaceae bacterium]|nr:hypothetical protein [Gemmatimonadaceae bacterium]